MSERRKNPFLTQLRRDGIRRIVCRLQKEQWVPNGVITDALFDLMEENENLRAEIDRLKTPSWMRAWRNLIDATSGH